LAEAHARAPQADFTTLWAPTCARRKVSPGEFTVKLAAAVQASGARVRPAA